MTIATLLVAVAGCSSSDDADSAAPDASQNSDAGVDSSAVDAPADSNDASQLSDAGADSLSVDAPIDSTSDVIDGALDGAVDAYGDAHDATADSSGSCTETLPDDEVGPPTFVMEQPFVQNYRVFDLGFLPGLPNLGSKHIGGMTLSPDDPNALLVMAPSETANTEIFEVPIERDECGHILRLSGNVSSWAKAPYGDANMYFLKSGHLLYSEWPRNNLTELDATTHAVLETTNLASLGVDKSIGGFGIVPPGYADAGQLRGVTWQAGNWFAIDYVVDTNGTLTFTAAHKRTTLSGGPGGFAYVPANSVNFATPHIIVAMWSTDKVNVYGVDEHGDPDPATEKAFFSSFPKPWGAYFDPVSGDYLFSTWSGSDTGKVFVVRGFAPPPGIF